MSKLVDLKRTKADQKADKPTPAGPADDPYPYGLRVSLGEDELKKLGVDLPKVGTKMHLRAHAVVHSASQDERQGGKRNRRVELQIQRLALEKRGAGSMEEAIDNGVDAADEHG
jgi:hypothetical protein